MKKGFFALFLLSLFFLNTYILNLGKSPDLTNHADIFLVNFILKHYMVIFASGNWSQLSTLPMFYGFSNSLFFTDHHLIFAIMVAPFYFLTREIILSTNLLIVLTIFSSTISMYLFSFHLTKKVLPSVLASVIFVFNPYVFSHFPDHLILFSLQWIPLIFLFFEKSLEKPKSINTFLFFIFLTLELASSLYYSVFLTVILPVYCGIRLWQTKTQVPKLINKGFIFGLIIFSLTAFISAYFYTRVYSKEPINRTIDLVQAYSPSIKDLFLDSSGDSISQNYLAKVFGYFDNSQITNNLLEKTEFWGFTVWFLFIASFILLRKSKRKWIWLLYLGLLLFCLILSFGPRINIFGNLNLPGPYGLLYKIDLLFSFLRAPGRFGVFTFFFLGLILALTLQEITARVSRKWGVALGLFIILLTSVEYLSVPIKFNDIPQEEKQFYGVLKKQNQIKVIVELPIASQIQFGTTGITTYNPNDHYLLWASILHSKKLLNGDSGFRPSEYTHRTAILSQNFPTIEKLKLLKEWGVDGIVLHKYEFTNSADFDFTEKGLEQLGVKKVTETHNLVLFDLSLWKEAP